MELQLPDMNENGRYDIGGMPREAGHARWITPMSAWTLRDMNTGENETMRITIVSSIATGLAMSVLQIWTACARQQEGNQQGVQDQAKERSGRRQMPIMMLKRC